MAEEDEGCVALGAGAAEVAEALEEGGEAMAGRDVTDRMEGERECERDLERDLSRGRMETIEGEEGAGESESATEEGSGTGERRPGRGGDRGGERERGERGEVAQCGEIVQCEAGAALRECASTGWRGRGKAGRAGEAGKASGLE